MKFIIIGHRHINLEQVEYLDLSYAPDSEQIGAQTQVHLVFTSGAVINLKHENAAEFRKQYGEYQKSFDAWSTMISPDYPLNYGSSPC